MKVSYACRPNVRSIINGHNREMLEKRSPLRSGSCNCINKDNCPLNGHCLTTNALYEAEISSTEYKDNRKLYKGITELKFKARYGNHKKSFSNDKYKKDSELSKEVWKLKEKKVNFTIKWRVIKQFPAYNQSSKRCSLCQNEKLAILEHKEGSLLNKRSEIISKCRHQNKYLLINAASKDINAAENIT